ncbi:GPW/gp25 family protein [Saccharicrinis aurantiacus]|uniref:GPW/gp25 family protein n=1 Tax=Saccharicrinis aurantiacus TaxID=1849719 RepID=UPI00094FCDA3|nr:GPW/gp25 family protein [Saccharicrinis aurantiacus]
MEKSNYKLPLQLSAFQNDEDGQLERCTILESIDQNLDLLLTTCPGEHVFNKKFGSRIWEMDFERVFSQSKWEEKFSGFVLESVRENEKRLSDVTVQVKIREVVKEDLSSNSVAIRKRVDIHIFGLLTEVNQKCGFTYAMYLGPLSKN